MVRNRCTLDVLLNLKLFTILAMHAVTHTASAYRRRTARSLHLTPDADDFVAYDSLNRRPTLSWAGFTTA